jgi:hypothetical protein
MTSLQSHRLRRLEHEGKTHRLGGGYQLFAALDTTLWGNGDAELRRHLGHAGLIRERAIALDVGEGDHRAAELVAHGKERLQRRIGDRDDDVRVPAANESFDFLHKPRRLRESAHHDRRSRHELRGAREGFLTTRADVHPMSGTSQRPHDGERTPLLSVGDEYRCLHRERSPAARSLNPDSDTSPGTKSRGAAIGSSAPGRTQPPSARSAMRYPAAAAARATAGENEPYG